MKTTHLLILMAIGFLLGFLGASYFSKRKNIKTDMDVQNYAALNDSLRKYKTENGQLVYEISSFLVKKNQLEKYNKELAEEAAKIQDKILAISKSKVKIIRDTVYLQSEGQPIFNNGRIAQTKFNWGHIDSLGVSNYRKLAGYYIISVDSNLAISTKKFAITTDEIAMSFSTGFTENKEGLLEIFLTSNYPGFRVNELSGAVIDPRSSKTLKSFFPDKKWHLGIYAGYGIYYDPSKSLAGNGFNVGLGINRSILSW